jgi:hypothetical protein
MDNNLLAIIIFLRQSLTYWRNPMNIVKAIFMGKNYLFVQPYRYIQRTLESLAYRAILSLQKVCQRAKNFSKKMVTPNFHFSAFVSLTKGRELSFLFPSSLDNSI